MNHRGKNEVIRHNRKHREKKGKTTQRLLTDGDDNYGKHTDLADAVILQEVSKIACIGPNDKLMWYDESQLQYKEGRVKSTNQVEVSVTMYDGTVLNRTREVCNLMSDQKYLMKIQDFVFKD